MVEKNQMFFSSLAMRGKKQKGKRGWIKVIEAFVSILFLISVVSIIIHSDNFQSKERPILKEKQVEILNGIQLNSSLRNEILLFSSYDLNSSSVGFPAGLKSHMESNKINNAECILKICPVNENCEIELSKDEIYAQSVLITSSHTDYNPKIAKIFCYEI